MVYDLRNGKCLGRVAGFNADLRPGYANFYGIFDNPIPALSLECKASQNQGATALTAQLSVPKTDTAALVTLVDPSGKRPDWAKRVVSVRGGTASTSWQLPVGSTGKWTIEARELFSGALVKQEILSK